MSEYFLIDRADRIATVSINRLERRNALNKEMAEELPGLVRDLSADPDVAAIILRGSGNQAFCAGADIVEMVDIVRKESITGPALRALMECPKVVIAMIHGYALGGGCALAMACDLRVLGRSAKMGIPAAKLGVVYTVESTTRLVDLVGPSRATRILFTAQTFDAQACLAMGLADEVYPDEQLEQQTRALAGQIAANAPLSIAGSKQIIRAYLADPTLQSAPEVFDLPGRAFASTDHREGKLAFVEKRRPVFRGC